MPLLTARPVQQTLRTPPRWPRPRLFRYRQLQRRATWRRSTAMFVTSASPARLRRITRSFFARRAPLESISTVTVSWSSRKAIGFASSASCCATTRRQLRRAVCAESRLERSSALTMVHYGYKWFFCTSTRGLALSPCDVPKNYVIRARDRQAAIVMARALTGWKKCPQAPAMNLFPPLRMSTHIGKLRIVAPDASALSAMCFP